MFLPLPVVREAFAPSGPDDASRLDFDAVGAPRTLRTRPAAADAEALADLRESLAWFWNTNADWAQEQVAVSDRYADLVHVLARGCGVSSGDAVVLSGSEPDVRRSAWRRALPEGVRLVRWAPRPTGRLALEDLEPLLEGRTRLVVQTKACPVSGSLNEVIPLAQRLAGSGVRVVCEASHFLAHGSLDLRNLRCDGLIASLDELFGASGAALWMRDPPGGSLNGAAAPATIASLSRSLAYVERLGEEREAPVAPPSERFGRREAMRRGMQAIRQEERVLSRRMLELLRRAPGVRVLGERESNRAAVRVPTFTFVAERVAGWDLGEALAAGGSRVGAGTLGAADVLSALGADPEAGAVRASLAHYHDAEDIRRFGDALESALRSSAPR